MYVKNRHCNRYVQCLQLQNEVNNLVPSHIPRGIFDELWPCCVKQRPLAIPGHSMADFACIQQDTWSLSYLTVPLPLFDPEHFFSGVLRFATVVYYVRQKEEQREVFLLVLSANLHQVFAFLKIH